MAGRAGSPEGTVAPRLLEAFSTALGPTGPLPLWLHFSEALEARSCAPLPSALPRTSRRRSTVRGGAGDTADITEGRPGTRARLKEKPPQADKRGKGGPPGSGACRSTGPCSGGGAPGGVSAGAGGVSVYGGVSARAGAGGVPVYGGGSGARRPGEETCRSWRLGGVHCEVAAGVTLRHWRGRVRAWGARVRRGPWPRPSRNPGLRGGRGPSGLRAGGGAGAARDGGLGGGRGPLGTAGWGEPSGRRAGGGAQNGGLGAPSGRQTPRGRSRPPASQRWASGVLSILWETQGLAPDISELSICARECVVLWLGAR